MIRRHGRPASRTSVAGPAAALAFAVVAWEQLYHSAIRGVRESAPAATHLLVDGALALPAALVAVVGGRRLAARRAGSHPPRRTEWAVIAAALFTLLLVPSVAAHHLVHEWVSAPARLPHLHGALAAEQGTGTLEMLRHGARDASLALPVALAVCLAALGRRAPAGGVRRRRAALLAAATALATLPVAASGSPAVTPFAAALPIPATLTGADVTLTAEQADVPVLPGAPTRMWTFNGAFPGPTIRRPSGEQTRVTVVNALPQPAAGEITLHHHGNHSASVHDGQPHGYLIPTGSSRTYTYDLVEGGAPERGAMQWYHDHRMDVTGRNVWMGLAGMVILDDPAEAGVNAALPNGDRDVPLMVVDRTFDAGNQIPYAFNPEGNLGDLVLVNGAPQPFFEVADVRYRLRLLNASNTRSYDFALSGGRSMIQVATESGLLPAPVVLDHLLLGPAERAEVIVDFSAAIGQDVVLENRLGRTPGVSQVMQFRVRRDEADSSNVPPSLRPVPFYTGEPLVATRPWIFGRDLLTGQWQINGRGFEHDRVDVHPKLDTTERWVFVNTTDVDHIVHIHDVDWRIELRTPTTPLEPGALLFEAGLKESFRLRPNEIVVVASHFSDHLGPYVLHCHMLEHEDFSMMTQFEVVP